MDSAVPVVYMSLHEGTAPFIDMPLDFIENKLEWFRYKQTHNRSVQKLHKVVGSFVDELL